MRIEITENQYKTILSKMDVDEQTETEPVSPEPVAGTSDTQSGHKAYPDVGKWESGVTRGPANQIDDKLTWSATVGSTLKRGKANQLK